MIGKTLYKLMPPAGTNCSCWIFNNMINLILRNDRTFKEIKPGEIS